MWFYNNFTNCLKLEHLLKLKIFFFCPNIFKVEPLKQNCLSLNRQVCQPQQNVHFQYTSIIIADKGYFFVVCIRIRCLGLVKRVHPHQANDIKIRCELAKNKLNKV